MSEVMAAWRDASFLNRPGRASRYHVLTEAGGAMCRSGAGEWHSRQSIPMQDDNAVPAGEVDPILRCQRNGCRQRWPAGPADPSDAPGLTVETTEMRRRAARGEEPTMDEIEQPYLSSDKPMTCAVCARQDMHGDGQTYSCGYCGSVWGDDGTPVSMPDIARGILRSREHHARAGNELHA